ncbi:MAG: hypothetical protein D6714_05940 [Bacteroidetes bacterium]|nr:MAG: hypothetical protein D6714_05940 [Bacteroidota bacterium]
MSKRKKIKKPESFISRFKKRFQQQSSVILFCMGLVAIMFVYYWLYSQDFFNENINLPILKAYAKAGNWVLNVFGMETHANATLISNDEFTLNVGKGCDAFSPMILILAAILTFPMPFKLKIPALLIAPVAIIILNIIRIVSLFFIGRYAPGIFEVAHVEIWQTAFIIFCLMGWLYWLIWANQKKQMITQN